MINISNKDKDREQNLKMVSTIDPGKIYISLFYKGTQILLKQSGCELYIGRCKIVIYMIYAVFQIFAYS